MKAVVCRSYGPPEDLKIADIDKPSVPDDGVLVRVKASSVNPADFFTLTRVAYIGRQLAGRFKARPVVPGIDFSGTVESVGRNVTQFQPGDEVFGGKRGALAEYVCLPQHDAVVLKPANVTFEQAGGVGVAALTALQAVRDHGHVRPGSKVVINGASGGVGTFAVQLAKSFGAEVTGVCSTGNVELVRSLGADTVIDYAREDFTRVRQRYDVMLDIAGNRSWSEYTRILTPTAAFVAVGGSSHTVFGGAQTLQHLVSLCLASVRGSRRFAFFIAKLTKPDLLVLQGLLESGAVTSVVDRQYTLSEVAAAFRYMGQGHAKGKIVITI
jgi:NADPH:quinone reductase-like Zn-dependent oxidoreductase